MAILQMKRVNLCAMKEDRKKILETLQNMGVMEIDTLDGSAFDLEKTDTSGARQGFERSVSLCEAALSVLDEYAPEKKPMLGSLNGKEEISRHDLKEVVLNRDKTVDQAARITGLAKRIAENKAQIQKIRAQIESLAPWMSLGVPMNMRGTAKTAVIIGSMPPGQTQESILSVLADRTSVPDSVDLDIVSSDSNAVNIALVCLKEDEQAVEEALRAAGFARPSMPVDRIPAKEVSRLEEKIARLEEKNEKAAKEIEELRDEREALRRTSDYFRMRSAKYAVLGTLPQSENTFMLRGFIPAEAAPALEKGIGERFDCLLEFEDVPEGEAQPTILRNNRFSETVEGVLKSYGLPTKGHVDPTFLMSIFYVIFFGMMLSDAGYGIVMAAGCFFALMKFKRMDAGLRKTLKMFFWCGLSTTFWGFMYGGFFGDAIDTVAKTFFGYTGDLILKPLWFAPLDDPMRLLMFCMLFGVIHLFVGLGIKGWELLKQKDYVGWVFDILAWYLLLVGLIVMLMQSDIFSSIAGREFVFPAAVGMAAKICAAAGAVMILIMSGRGRKNWALRIALGAYDLYGISSWLSDVLSYSRLLALGLATGVIANVINMMATMAGKGIVKVILFIIIFILGHTLNIGINALGAYVHTNRLQFVEFFGKFYEGGGKEFRPFKAANKYVELKEEKQL